MKVTVNPGRTVSYNKKDYPPGKSFEIDDKEGKRLLKREIVSLSEENNGSDGSCKDFPSGIESGPLSREQLLEVAIGFLDPDKSNKEFWTRKGVPQASALAEILGDGDPVTAKERDAAYAVFQSANKPQE